MRTLSHYLYIAFTHFRSHFHTDIFCILYVITFALSHFCILYEASAISVNHTKINAHHVVSLNEHCKTPLDYHMSDMTLLEAYILGDMLAIYWCMIKFNVKHCVVETGNLATIYTNGIVLRPNSTWLDSTRHVRRVEPMHFGCVELVEQHSSTRSDFEFDTAAFGI